MDITFENVWAQTHPRSALKYTWPTFEVVETRFGERQSCVIRHSWL